MPFSPPCRPPALSVKSPFLFQCSDDFFFSTLLKNQILKNCPFHRMEMDLCWFSTFHLLVHFSSKRSMCLGYEKTFGPMWACVSSSTALSYRGCFSHSGSPLSSGAALAEGAEFHRPIALFTSLLRCWFRQVTSFPTRKADTAAQKPLAPFSMWPSLTLYLSCGPQLLRLWWALPKCLCWSFAAELGLGAQGADQVDKDSSLPQLPSQASACGGLSLFSPLLLLPNKIVCTEDIFSASALGGVQAKRPVKTSRTCRILTEGSWAASEWLDGAWPPPATCFRWFSALCAACGPCPWRVLVSSRCRLRPGWIPALRCLLPGSAG